MEEEKSSKFKNKKPLIFLICILIVLEVLLITFSLLFGFGILGSKKTILTSGESVEESAAENDISSAVVPITADEAYEAYNSGRDYIFLDVRSEDEYNSGHIKGAVLIPVDTLESRLNELPEDKPIIVYCKAGVRSARAAGILVENGFTEVYDMDGGITEWIDKGYPTISEE